MFNGDLIKDKSIVEFVYDKNEEPLFRWKPLREKRQFNAKCLFHCHEYLEYHFLSLNRRYDHPEIIFPIYVVHYSDFKDKKSTMSGTAQYHNIVKKYLIQDVSKPNYRSS